MVSVTQFSIPVLYQTSVIYVKPGLVEQLLQTTLSPYFSCWQFLASGTELEQLLCLQKGKYCENIVLASFSFFKILAV